MPTLKAVLEEVAGLGPGYLISDHGAYWLVSDVREHLERGAPERLTFPVSWVVPTETAEGAIYASDDTEEVLSVLPLYGIHRITSTLEPLDFSAPETPHP